MNQRQKAFMELYGECHEAFLRYCSALAYGRLEVQDLVQDVLLSAYTHFDAIRKKEDLMHYLIRAARNRAISIRRRKHFQTEILEHQKERLVAQGLNLEMALDIQLLYWCLDQLPEKQGDALLLFEISGFSIKEIAHIQKSKENAVKTRLSRARQKLKELMAQKPNVHSTLGILGTLKTITL